MANRLVIRIFLKNLNHKAIAIKCDRTKSKLGRYTFRICERFEIEYPLWRFVTFFCPMVEEITNATYMISVQQVVLKKKHRNCIWQPVSNKSFSACNTMSMVLAECKETCKRFA